MIITDSMIINIRRKVFSSELFSNYTSLGSNVKTGAFINAVRVHLGFFLTILKCLESPVLCGLGFDFHRGGSFPTSGRSAGSVTTPPHS